MNALASSTTSTDFIDIEFCKKKKIKVFSLENEQKFLSSISSTAEHTFGLILLITRKYISAINSVEKSRFNRRPFGVIKCYLSAWDNWVWKIRKTGKKIASGFSMKIIFCDIKDKNYKKKLKKI